MELIGVLVAAVFLLAVLAYLVYSEVRQLHQDNKRIGVVLSTERPYPHKVLTEGLRKDLVKPAVAHTVRPTAPRPPRPAPKLESVEASSLDMADCATSIVVAEVVSSVFSSDSTPAVEPYKGGGGDFGGGGASDSWSSSSSDSSSSSSCDSSSSSSSSCD